MLEFQQRRKIKRFIYSRVMLIVLLVILFFVLKGVWGVYEKQQYTKDNLNKVSGDLQRLREREARLSTQINWLKTYNGTEAEIRDKYGLVKPGEEVITIVEPESSSSTDSLSENRKFWQKVWNWLQ